MFEHEFAWSDIMDVWVEYIVLEAEPGYQREIEIQGIQVNHGDGWTTAFDHDEDAIINHVYENMQSQLIEEAS
jgi:hypothetical protein